MIAGDGDDNRYFKRLRRGEANTVVLESLEISGDFPPIVLTYQTGQTADLQRSLARLRRSLRAALRVVFQVNGTRSRS